MKQLPKNIANKISKPSDTDCWLWTGTKNRPNGYGVTQINKIRILAHRAVYQILIGDIPNGKVVCHTCDVRNCVNPDHLWIGTQSENILDAFKKGRRVGNNNVYGEKCGKSKLNNAAVSFIRKEHPKISITRLAKKFGVVNSTIERILNNKTWRKP